MKKILFFCSLMFLFGIGTYAQNNNYGSNSYTFTKVDGKPYVEIVGSKLSAAKGINAAENISLPFKFNYAGIDYTDARISTNGWLMFFSKNNPPVVTSAENSIRSKSVYCALFPLFGKMDASNGEIRYQQNIIDKDTLFVIQWKNVKTSDSTQNFQIKLHKNTNVIEFVYGKMKDAPADFTSTIGINTYYPYPPTKYMKYAVEEPQFININPTYTGATASSTVTYNYVQSFSYIKEGTIYRFTPPVCPSPGNAEISYITNVSANVKFPKEGTYTVEYKKTAEATWTTISVTGSKTTLSGLASETTYDVRLKNACSPNYSPVVSFTTLITPPWKESFETIDPATGLPKGMVAKTAYPSVHVWDIDTVNPYEGRNALKVLQNNYVTTPGFYLEKGKTYRFSYFYSKKGSSLGFDVDAKFGYSQNTATENFLKDGGGTMVHAWDYGNGYYRFSVEFTPKLDTVHFFSVITSTDGSNAAFHIDNILMEEALCPDVSRIKARVTTDPSVGDVTFDSDGKTGFIIQYKKKSDANWITWNPTTDGYTQNDKHIKIKGLEYSTAYQVRCRSNCESIQGPSMWSDISEFTTGCPAMKFADIERFPLSSCWTTSSGNLGTNATRFTTPPVSFASAGSGYLISPAIPSDISPSTLQIGLNFLSIGGGESKITIGVLKDLSDPDPNSASFLFADSIKTKGLGDFQYVNAQLNNAIHPQTDFYYIMIVFSGGWVDDLLLDRSTPSCNLEVTGLKTASTSVGGMTIVWNKTPGATDGYTFRYKKSTDATFSLPESLTDTTKILTGLGTGWYDILVNAKCSPTNSGKTAYLSAQPSPSVTAPWVERLNSITLPPPLMAVKGATTTTNLSMSVPYINSRFSATGKYTLYFAGYSTLDEWIFTPVVSNLTVGKKYQVSLKVSTQGKTPVTDGNSFFRQILIKAGPLQDKNSMGSDIVGKFDTITNIGYKKLVATFEPKNNDPMCFGIHLIANNPGSFSIDDFEIKEAPAYETTVKNLTVIAKDIINKSISIKWDETDPDDFYEVLIKKDTATKWVSLDDFIPYTNSFKIQTSPRFTLDYGLYSIRVVPIHGSARGDSTEVWVPFFEPLKTVPYLVAYNYDSFNDNRNLPKDISVLGANDKSTVTCTKGAANESVKQAPIMFWGKEDAPGAYLTVVGPALDPSIVKNNLQVKYGVKNIAAGTIELGYLTNPQNIASFVSLGAPFTPPSPANMILTTYTATFPGTVTQPIYLAFRMPKNGTMGLLLDSISIDTIKVLNCQINNLTATNPAAATSINVTWGSPQAKFQLGYKASTSSEWITTTITNSRSANITNLHPGITYNIRVAPYCSANEDDLGAYSTISYSLPCVTNVLPYTEDFAAGLPSCWSLWHTQVKTIRDTTWNATKDTIKGITVTENPLFPGQRAGSPTWHITNFKNSKTEQHNSMGITMYTAYALQWLMSPQIDFGQTGNATIEFDAALTGSGPNPISEGAAGNYSFSVYLIKADPYQGMSDADLKAGGSVNPIIKFDTSSNAVLKFTVDLPYTGSHFSVPIAGYTGQFRIGFLSETGINQTGNVDLFVTNLNVAPNKVCPPIDFVLIPASRILQEEAQVSWTSTSPRTQIKYDVYYGEPGKPISQFQKISADSAARSVTIKGLSQEKQYQVYVGAYCGSNRIIKDTSDLSSPQVFNTKSPCQAVSDVNVSNTTESSTIVKWTKNAPQQSQWVLSYTPQGGNPITKMVYTNTVDTLKGLNANTLYTVKVRGVCGAADTSAWSTEATFTTKCAAVSNLTYTSVDIDKATLSWQGSASQWKIEYGKERFTVGTGTVLYTNQNPYVLRNLMPATSYDVYISAICTSTTSDTSAAQKTTFMTTSDCQSVTNVVVTVNSAKTGATVTWDSDNNTSYSVEYGTTGFFEGTGEKMTVSQKTADLTNLTPNVAYDVIVRAICSETNTSVPVHQNFFTNISNIEAENVNVTLVPNPAKDKTTITLTGVTGNIKLQIINIKGEVVYTDGLYCQNNCSKEITLDKLAKGNYVVRLISDKFVKIQKLVVQ